MYCTKCNGRIVGHIWWQQGKAYCGASCLRGGKSQFERVWKSLKDMGKDGRTDAVLADTRKRRR